MELSLKIVSVDSYLAKPLPGYDPIYSSFTSTGISQVPVLRVFGINSSGSKGCLHVHGVFPYLFVPIPKGEENVDGFKHYLAKNLNDAINSTMDSYKSTEGQNIFKITKVRGIPFYGFHSESEEFFKIYLYRPFLVKKCAALLQSGAICGRRFQPHEAHIPFVQQFFIDYNLYGMSPINLTKYASRQSNSQSSCFPKATRCSFEADVLADDILNNVDLTGNSGVKNPGLAYIWEDEKERRREEGQTSQISFAQYDNVDVRYKSCVEEELLARMKLAIKDRTKQNRTNSTETQFSSNESRLADASFVESHELDKTYPLLDSQDMQLLEDFARDWDVEEGKSDLEDGERPEDDSVLGSQQQHLDDSLDDVEVDDPDLTLPFHVSVDDDSDGENHNDRIEMTIRYSSDSDSSEGTDIVYVDGNVDDPSDSSSQTTPQKRKKKQKPPTPTRYNPLGIRIQKSPSRGVNHDRSETGVSGTGINSSDFARLQESASAFPNTSLFGLDSSKESDKFIKLDEYEKQGLNTACSKFISQLKSTTERFETSANHDSRSAKKSLKFEDSIPESPPISSIRNSDPVNIGLSHVRNGESLKNFSISSHPPDPKDVMDNLESLGLQHLSPQQAFYGCPQDQPTTKEIGFLRVSVASRFARDLEEHKSLFGPRISLFHDLMFKSIFSSSVQPANTNLASGVLHSLSSNKSIVLTPLMDPPSQSVAEGWLAELRKSKMKAEDQCLLRPTVDPVEDETIRKPGPSSQSSIVFDTQTSYSTQMSDGNASVKLTQCMREESSRKLSPLVHQRRSSCLIEEATADNSGAFKMEFQNLQEASNSSMYTFLTICVMAVHVNTRSTLKPNPEYDAVEAIFYVITNDVPADHELPAIITGIVMMDSAADRITSHDDSYSVDLVSSEKDMYSKFISIIHHHDPDIFAGYEIEMSSWGYLIHRGYVIGMNMCSELSRLSVNPSFKVDLEQLRMRDFDMKISGRILLNVWRMMKHEVSLMSYSFENMAYHILHTRVPHYSHQTLTLWWNHLSSKKRILTIKYYLTRVRGIVKLLDSLNLIGRTSEMASLFGIQFYEVLSRGSQFRVESMMIRLAKPLNYVAVSPDVQQRADMRAPACLPLIMEPESRFYSDPVIVLDFQSLYPSMMIAYNYCFSTCLGRVEEIIEVDRFKFGCTELTINPKELNGMKDSIHISPAGVAFVGSSVRKGVLPCMLDEILETRLMVKKSMKAHKNNKILHRVLDARQMGLKLIANVTYGYTSANFSGRMPCIEVGDSVVSKGRETLERAIKLVKETARWKAEVVYGDTDSLFVLCPGRSRQEAFAIGQEISDAVTNSNPRPVKLKLEKVYQPCILQTKKRYVGYMYETPDQEMPIFEAKGIETVRRDGCVAVAKMLEKSLKILFETYDVSQVKKEYRGMKGYKPNACVPALQLVRDWLMRDPRAEPRVGERVGYCIVYGPPGVPLIRLVRDPVEVLTDPTIHINAEYYITKVILPPLQRCFTLLGVDTFSWYKSLPRVRKAQRRLIPKAKTQKSTLSQFFATVNCIICHEVSTTAVCSKCQSNEQLVMAVVSRNISRIQRKAFLLNKVCSSCCGRPDDLLCDSLNCPVYYRKCLSNVGLREMEFLTNALSEL
ncbi:hypothetical protein GE061_020030 [Apolygus lucorum]|uniref:DNA polymerase n=1 Tax=Apolygus lucorum TaxID=248454 RepID=A0A8S9XCQ4_APOLU|nr:hypothetical protein GE061_020030 [Apolygus lucorum]